MKTSQTVLVTGGTGFIGSRLALVCAEHGDRVRILAQHNTGAERRNGEQLEQQGLHVVEGSVTDLQTVERAMQGVDVVYHLAAAQHEANVPDRHYFDVNVSGTRHMLEAAARTGVTRFVHGSTIGVYGMGTNGAVHDDSPLNPDNIYGITKLEAEKVAHGFLGRLPISLIRISETYGPGDRRLLKLFKGIKKRAFVPIGRGQNLHHPIYVDDLVEGMRQAAWMEAAVGQTFVLAGPRPLTSNEMITSIADALGARRPKLRIPLWPLMGTAILMEAALRPLGIQPPLHRRRMNFFVKSFAFTCQAARSNLGFAPAVDFDEGVRRTADWYHKMQLL